MQQNYKELELSFPSRFWNLGCIALTSPLNEHQNTTEKGLYFLLESFLTEVFFSSFSPFRRAASFKEKDITQPILDKTIGQHPSLQIIPHNSD